MMGWSLKVNDTLGVFNYRFELFSKGFDMDLVHLKRAIAMSLEDPEVQAEEVKEVEEDEEEVLRKAIAMSLEEDDD